MPPDIAEILINLRLRQLFCAHSGWWQPRFLDFRDGLVLQDVRHILQRPGKVRKICLRGKRNSLCHAFSCGGKACARAGSRPGYDVFNYVSYVRSWKQPSSCLCSRRFHWFFFDLCVRRRCKSSCSHAAGDFAGICLRYVWEVFVQCEKG